MEWHKKTTPYPAKEKITYTMTRFSLSPRLTLKSSAAMATCYTLAILAVVFIYAGISTGSGLAHLDMPVHSWLVEQRTSQFTLSMQAITELFGPVPLILIAVCGGGLWAWKKKDYWRPLLFSVALGGAFGVSMVIKALVERARPPFGDMILPLETGYSFPSIHTLAIALFTLLLGYLVYSRRPSKRVFILWISLFVLGTVIMALSRMYLGYHWLTDVTASVGLAFSLFAVAILADCYRAWRLKSTKVL